MVLLQISSQDNLIIPYHNKIISKCEACLKNIHPDFLNSNPIVSGSYAINLVYSPESFHNDIDIYFASQNDFDLAKSYIETLYPNSKKFQTENAISFSIEENKEVQLICKFFLPPEELIYKHDFIVSSVAISNSKVYTTLETFKAWSKSELSFRDYQFPESNKDLNKVFIRLFNIINRIDKYSKRYSLDITPSTYQDLKSIYNLISSKDYLDENNFIDSPNIQTPVLDYYGRTVNSKITYKEIISSLYKLLKQENDDSDILPPSFEKDNFFTL